MQPRTRNHKISLHSCTSKKSKKLTDVSKRIYHVHKNIKKNTPNTNRLHEEEEYNELQRELRMDSDVLETAKQLRIQSFYKSQTKNSLLLIGQRKTTFQKHHSILYENVVVTDLDQIVQIIRNDSKKSTSTDVTPHRVSMHFIPSCYDNFFLSPANTTLPMHYSAHLAYPHRIT
jgi:hypothetical protein